MRFALVNNERVKAKPGLKGICRRCGQPMIPKCGTQKIHHWAHKSKTSCGGGKTTEWHLSWQDCFPDDWQEVCLPDKETGEKHWADVCTEHGLVIEFQRSSIKSEERISRENFYKNMVWVVDGTRLKKDYERFLESKYAIRPFKPGIWFCSFPEKYFPKNWVQNSKPVIFDFLGLEEATNLNDPRKSLYCLFPQRIGNEVMLMAISRKEFIDTANNGKFLNFISTQINTLNQIQQEYQKAQRQKEQGGINMLLQRSRHPRRRGRRSWL